jgi:hypothetical protein
MATVRCRGSRNMLRINDSVDGASVAPAMPNNARAPISIHVRFEQAATPTRCRSLQRAHHQQAPAADAIAQAAHRDQQTRDEEPVDVDDPQQLGAAGAQVLTDARQCQVQHRQVHRIQQARQGDDRQADPFASTGLCDGSDQRANMIGAVRPRPSGCRHTGHDDGNPLAVVGRGKSEVASGTPPVAPALTVQG